MKSVVAVLAFTSVLVAWAAVAEAQSEPLVAPIGKTWAASGSFGFSGQSGQSGSDAQKQITKYRESISGLGCVSVSGGKFTCVAAFDEGGEARYLTLDPTTATATAESTKLPLLASADNSRELDAEGVAYDSSTKMMYVTGSHSPKRKTCDANSDSRHIYRFPVNGTSGRATLVSGTVSGLVDKSFWTLLNNETKLKSQVSSKACLGSTYPGSGYSSYNHFAANIEGLAVRGGRIYAGLRDTYTEKLIRVYSVMADPLFTGTGALAPLVHEIAARSGEGIRDMQAVSDGILLLIGPDDDDANAGIGWRIALWRAADLVSTTVNVVPLARLDMTGVPKRWCQDTDPNHSYGSSNIKPESLVVLRDTTGLAYRVLVLSDGQCDGAPVLFEIPRG